MSARERARPAPLRLRHALPAVLAAGALAWAAGACVKRPAGMLVPNQRPVIELEHAPASSTVPYTYAYTLEWFAYDPDGAIDHFEYAVDPAPDDTAWVRTEDHETRLVFRSDEPDPSGAAGQAVAFHVFLIKAFDRQGLASVPETRAFFTRTVAPSVIITTPIPNALLPANLSSSIELHWTGTDPDGVNSKAPVAYKYLLLTSSSSFPQSVAISDPDSLRRYFAPAFAGWDSTPGDRPLVHFTNLTPGATYVFVVVAIDEAGAYSPVFSLNTNVLRFKVSLAATIGPTFTLYNDYFRYTYPSGGYTLDPRAEIPLDVLPDHTVRISWFAVPNAGSAVVAYRWRLDGDVSDETPRSDEETDVGHWSTPSALTLTAEVGPFPAGEEHRFYVEASDDLGLRSLGIVRTRVLGAAMSRDLLIVDDTRLLPDQAGPGGCPLPASGYWPTAAELDTFLYARGNVPWRCLPAGTLTPPGLFAGYAYDTLGTTDDVFSFTTLSTYRHVIWIVDALSALNNGRHDRTSLRVMNSGGVINALAAYVGQGGRLWLLGGGTAQAATPQGLHPGGFYYEATGWRSDYDATRAQATMIRSARAVGGWPMAPDYALLPPTLSLKTLATDPLPPTRTGQAFFLYYHSLDFEFLSQPNEVLEDVSMVPGMPDTASTLDTLYRAVGPGLPSTNPENVTMTYYHGADGTRVVTSGFDLWNLQKAQCTKVVDFVLQQIWGLPKSAAP